MYRLFISKLKQITILKTSFSFFNERARCSLFLATATETSFLLKNNDQKSVTEMDISVTSDSWELNRKLLTQTRYQTKNKVEKLRFQAKFHFLHYTTDYINQLIGLNCWEI